MEENKFLPDNQHEFRTKVGIHQEDPKHNNLTATQIPQNKILRLLDNSTLKERRSTLDMLSKFGLLSVNQLAANIKLTESWKCINENKYKIKLIMNKKMMVTI
jgi:hypothetical protein